MLIVSGVRKRASLEKTFKHNIHAVELELEHIYHKLVVEIAAAVDDDDIRSGDDFLEVEKQENRKERRRFHSHSHSNRQRQQNCSSKESSCNQKIRILHRI